MFAEAWQLQLLEPHFSPWLFPALRLHSYGLCTGIGLGTAQVMAREGYDLVLGYHANKDAAQEIKHQLEQEFKIKVLTVGGDIAAPATMQKLFDAISGHFNNQCSAFVHNAGLFVGVTTQATELQPGQDAEFEQTWDYYQKVYPQAFKRGLNLALNCSGFKHAVAISSPGCNANYPPRVGYENPGQAKAAVEFLVRSQASALAGKGINVNCVIPGVVLTGALDAVAKSIGQTMDDVKTYCQSTPAKRWAEPTEIGEAVAFLCSSKGSFITGVSLPVDGGLHLQHAELNLNIK